MSKNVLSGTPVVNSNTTESSNLESILNTTNSADIKQARKMTCALGEAPWRSLDQYKQVAEFWEVFQRRPGGKNNGGAGFFHYFALWNIVRSIKPDHIIESGCHTGVGSWFLRQAAGNDVKMIFLSPEHPGIYQDKNPSSVYFTGKNFKDFNKISWDTEIPDKSKTFIFFDDHMASIRRIKEARDFGFKHISFDDNYIPGHGDNLSGKKLCNRGNLHSFLGVRIFRFQDAFNSVNKKITKIQYKQYAEDFFAAIKVYSEFPPVWKGPNRFSISDSSWESISESPLFSLPQLKEIGVSVEWDAEARRYTHFLYVELKRKEEL